LDQLARSRTERRVDRRRAADEVERDRKRPLEDAPAFVERRDADRARRPHLPDVAPIEIVEEALERDRYMTAEEAKAWGHIDAIVEKREAVATPS
jgi:hypothetical protein